MRSEIRVRCNVQAKHVRHILHHGAPLVPCLTSSSADERRDKRCLMTRAGEWVHSAMMVMYSAFMFAWTGTVAQGHTCVISSSAPVPSRRHHGTSCPRAARSWSSMESSISARPRPDTWRSVAPVTRAKWVQSEGGTGAPPLLHGSHASKKKNVLCACVLVPAHC